ncbi:hypothetical protein AYJ08_05790 [Brevibacillus sp. SKDU10]|uniref:hypothetical protein n=1 Tax=Brevibacillus sp. SKDU10 TaxID=1247872 RepID=UPI0007C900B8|nr:hypothetical protein [Brevibacillus sp. SKDU10]OAJ75128.1 hypothetical protein AYJ08_05790 [Brevibacillus sp. SKDU10]
MEIVTIEDSMRREYLDQDVHLMRVELRQLIQRKMWSLGFVKMSTLADMMKYSKGGLSKILSSNADTAFTLDLLDRLTSALGLEQGYFYSYFVFECYKKSGRLDIKKCKSFIEQCLLQGMSDLANRTSFLLLNQKESLETLFKLAESLYERHLYDEAVHIYSAIRDGWDGQITTSYATSMYRLFLIHRSFMRTRGESSKNSYIALVKLLGVQKHLTPKLYLDSLLEISYFYNLVEDFENTERYTREAKRYCENLLNDGNLELCGITRDELDSYYAESLMNLSFSLKGAGKYPFVYELIDQYSKINDYFFDLSIGNRLLTEIEEGKIESINEFFKWANGRREHMRSIVPTALSAYLKTGKIKEATIFLHDNRELIKFIENELYTLGIKYRISYNQLMGSYLLYMNRFEEGLNKLLIALEWSEHMGNNFRSKKITAVFAKHYNKASQEQREKYNSMMEG